MQEKRRLYLLHFARENYVIDTWGKKSPNLLQIGKSIEQPRIALEITGPRLILQSKSRKKNFVQNMKVKYMTGPCLKFLKLTNFQAPLLDRQEKLTRGQGHSRYQLARQGRVSMRNYTIGAHIIGIIDCT